jgi:acyl-CoA thioesterase
MELEDLRSRMSPDAQQYAERTLDMYNAPFARVLGIEIESIDLDRVVCSLTVRPEQMNSMGRAHGATIYGLIDHTFAIASNLVRDCTGSSTNCIFYRPGSGKLTAVAVPINRSRSMEMYDIRVTNEEGKLVASSTCTAFAIKRDRDGRQVLPILR